MKRRSNRGVIIVLVVLIALLAGLIAGMLWFLNTHFFINGRAYADDAQTLDLRGKTVTLAEYEAIQAELPDCRIHWDVPFQNTAYADDTTAITVSSLSDQDLDMLEYLPALTSINAEACRDYPQLEALRQRYPDLKVSYYVTIDGKEYPQDAQSITVSALTDTDIEMVGHLWELKRVDASACQDYAQLSSLREIHPELEVLYTVEVLGRTLTQDDVDVSFDKPEISALKTQLAYAVNLEAVHMEEPVGEAQALQELLEAYPNIDFTWNKTVLGNTYSSTQTEFDFSGRSFSSTDEVESAMKYFPNAEKVIMSDCGFDNETMAAFREKMRPEYKVVWTVYITKKPVRTDATVIHSSALKVCFIDEQSYDLKYCEDAVVVDIGHSYVKYIDWVQYMPNLKYLILTHNWIKDLTPISTCKNLVYLEIYWNDHIPDYTPLLGCTALKDLNVSGTFADPTPLAQMTWLDNLWATQTGWSSAEQKMLTEALPNTTLKFGAIDYSAGGWRQVPGYFEMRDIMGLGYNTW